MNPLYEIYSSRKPPTPCNPVCTDKLTECNSCKFHLHLYATIQSTVTFTEDIIKTPELALLYNRDPIMSFSSLMNVYFGQVFLVFATIGFARQGEQSNQDKLTEIENDLKHQWNLTESYIKEHERTKLEIVQGLEKFIIYAMNTFSGFTEKEYSQSLEALQCIYLESVKSSQPKTRREAKLISAWLKELNVQTGGVKRSLREFEE